MIICMYMYNVLKFLMNYCKVYKHNIGSTLSSYSIFSSLKNEKKSRNMKYTKKKIRGKRGPSPREIL